MSRDLLKSRSVTKDLLLDMILSIGPLICKSKSVLRSASATFDEQKSELLANQKSLIKAKEDLITSQKLKFDTVQETVKKEIQTFSDVNIENCSGNGSNAVTAAKLKRAMRTAIIDEEQSHDFLILGADEELYRDEDDINDEELLEEILSTIKVNCSVEKCRRVGIKKSDRPGRPIKVTLRSPDNVRDVLSRAKVLKSIIASSFSFKFNRLYLSPHRTEEERKVRQKLVKEMKDRILEDSSKRYFIKDNKVQWL